MMMTDMLPGQRESVRQLHAPILEAALETDDYELLEIVPLLWTGWECDTHAALVRVEGRTRIVILDPVHALEGHARDMLLQRLQAYSEAAYDLGRFIKAADAAGAG